MAGVEVGDAIEKSGGFLRLAHNSGFSNWLEWSGVEVRGP